MVLDEHLLLLKVLDRQTRRTFWLFPGGGRDACETEEQCVQGEVWEETHLSVGVTRFLFEVPDIPEGSYDWLRTYLCVVEAGTARPGIEPELDGDGQSTIQAIGWFHLRQPDTWDALLREDDITYRKLQRVRAMLGYLL